ncbi:MAG: phospholipase A [Povalibacter sp.]
MLRTLPVFCLVLLASGARADMVLSSGSTHVSSGSGLQLSLTITNESAEALSVDLPDQIHVRLETAAAVSTLEFVPERTGELIVAPREFAKVQLHGELPTGLDGTVTLQPTGFASNAVVLHIDGTATPPQTDEQIKQANESQSQLVDKPPALAVSVYEPVYFIVGGDGGLNAKFQISFRYRLFDGKGPMARSLPWIDDLYLAFSQTSLWDLGELSKPFTDSSYRPRLFYADYDLARVFDGRMRLGVETGFGHESNGREGEESRSFNMLYVRPTLTFGDPDGLRFYLAPLIHNYVAADENPDIADYRGYVDWQVGFGSKGGLDFWATLRKGTRSNYGSAELNFSYPLSKLSGGDLTSWLTLQYFAGYGESLINYREKLDSQLRLGIAIAL